MAAHLTLGLRRRLRRLDVRFIAYPVPFRIGAGSTRNRIRAVVVHERSGALRIADASTVGFSLCGRGPSCSLDVDTVERRLLARREALEVALYTLAYLNFGRVVVLLPPRPGDDHPVTALLFRRDDLASLLDKPLRATISTKVPTVTQLDGRIGARLGRLTAPYFYAVGYVPAPGDAAPAITLAPAEAG